MIPPFVYTLATFNGFTGVIWGAALACLGKAIKVELKAAKAEVIAMWHTFCRFAAHMHIKQTTVDTAAIDLLDKAKPAIDQAFEDARAGLVAERATAAAVEADTVQDGSLAVKPVDTAPLPAVAVAAVVVAP